MVFNAKSFLNKCLRVWHILRKPTKDEFLTISKISAIGVIIIGFVGFVISMVVRFIIHR